MKYFGTDGIRGIANEDLTNEIVYKMGRSLRIFNKKEVYIATDTRISKDMIFCSLASGIMSCGMNVFMLGVLSTPALMYFCKQNKALGVMITASHNPYYDNGIKIINNGVKISNLDEIEIEKNMEIPVENKFNIGKLFFNNVAKKEYINCILSKANKTKFNISIDCSNGATSEICYDIFSRLCNKVYYCASSPDGFNINKDVGSTNIEFLKKKVVENESDLGFAFDGDGDRVILVDSNGNVIDGDKIVYLLSLWLKKENKLNDNKVVLTIMSNLGIVDALQEQGIEVVFVDVGDRNVSDALTKYNLSLGGENSGHIIFKDESSYGDGILIATLLLKILDNNINLLEELKRIQLYSSLSSNILLKNKEKFVKNFELLNELELIKNKYKECKIIVRPSGTENLLRLTVMAKGEEYCKNVLDYLVSFLKERLVNE